ncbi:MAG: hypothetical protein K6E89_06375 [Sphaerochaetaceae bacterium]|nr:hypothetical protein [Sphaerochaetaceae bacterium]
MRKHILPVLLVIAVLLVATISCKNNPSPTPTPTPTRPATLSVYSFKSNYAVGATKADLVGTLVYTDTNAKVTTVDIKAEGVTTDFDATAAAEGKILKISYQGIDTTARYNVVKAEEVDIAGTFILGKNVSYEFSSGSTTVKKEEWGSWSNFFNLDAEPIVKSVSYTVGISPSGRTTIHLDGWTYSPDGKGGLASYPSEGQYFDYSEGYVPNTGYYYVSTTAEDTRSITNPDAQGKYLVMEFKGTNGDVNVYFTDDVAAGTLTALTDGDIAYTIPAIQMIFDNSGVYMKNETVNDTNAKNLSIYLNKDGYNSKERAFSIVSSSDDGYKGYSYTMKLSDIGI